MVNISFKEIGGKSMIKIFFKGKSCKISSVVSIHFSGVESGVAIGDTFPVPPCFEDRTNAKLESQYLWILIGIKTNKPNLCTFFNHYWIRLLPSVGMVKKTQPKSLRKGLFLGSWFMALKNTQKLSKIDKIMCKCVD